MSLLVKTLSLWPLFPITGAQDPAAPHKGLVLLYPRHMAWLERPDTSAAVVACVGA